MSDRLITSDFLVIGGGVIGINIARCLKRQYSDSSVALIEKEENCGLHASGRNSGVLHAGFYYSPIVSRRNLLDSETNSSRSTARERRLP